MRLPNRLLALFAPLAFLFLAACATGFPAQVQRFQAMPAPAGQSFVVEPADPSLRGSLEFSQYASLVSRHMMGLGYHEAPSRDQATMIVTMDYGVDSGRERVTVRPDPFPHHGFYRPYYSRFGYLGPYRSPFYWGWHDPFLFGPSFGRGYDVDSYTVYTSYLDLDITRRADGQSLFEGVAQARSRSDALPRLVPNLIEAMFTGFPGNSGETVRITVAPEDRRR